MKKQDIPVAWHPALDSFFESSGFSDLCHFLKLERQSHTVYPLESQTFKVLEILTPEAVRVVILGQDPYHGPGQANGLSFSVSDDQKIPPSLRNIFKEIQQDIGGPVATSGNLRRWADQGVLLLNAILTVRAGVAGSHRKKGWESFSDAIISYISETTEHRVFMLWGNFAREKAWLINAEKHLVLTSGHPSPLSIRHFRGNRHFSRANQYLTRHQFDKIAW